jgi:hypothetical protein
VCIGGTASESCVVPISLVSCQPGWICSAPSSVVHTHGVIGMPYFPPHQVMTYWHLVQAMPYHFIHAAASYTRTDTGR